MDEQRARIYDDLKGLLAGDLLFEPVERAPYALDASLYEIDPLGVVAPRSGDDLVALVRYAAEHQIPLHPRGAGTGLAGGCLGAGLVIDFSRYLRRIIAVGPESVVVQPGVVLDVLNAHLAPFGRRIGPDTNGSEASTIGGMIGRDAAGIRSLRYGTMADHVERLRAVFANGEVAELGCEPRPIGDEEPEDLKGAVVRRLGVLFDWYADLIARSGPRAPRNRAGYGLRGVALPDGRLDLARLLVGSEGTLAMVAEATLKTVPIPPCQSAALLPFARLADAAEAVVACLEEGPSACELHDWRSLRMVRDAEPSYRALIPAAAEAALVVEFEGEEPSEVSGRLRRLTRRLARRGALAAEPVEANRRCDGERLLGLRRVARRLMMRSRGPLQPVPLIEDIAVPPDRLADFLGKLQNILKRHEVSWTVYGHAGHGQLHPRPFLDLNDPRDRDRLEPIATEVYEAVFEVGGTISGEHGCGLARTQFVRRQYGELAVVFREIKAVFDPQNLLNPGKVVGDDPHLMTRDLRAPLGRPAPAAEPAALPVLDSPLLWADRDREEHIAACNSCGACRSQEPTLRMCPVFRASHAEAASPRAKVNLLRQIASGTLDPKLWGTEELKQNADLCVHCQLCESECPAGIDISSLMLEAKAAYVEHHGLTPQDWLLSRVDLWAEWASRFPIVFNALMGARASRWLLERAFGLSRLRSLPRAHRTPFVRRAQRLGLTRPKPQVPGPRVAYFVDLFANHFDQELAEAVVAVLRHAGVNVFVPEGQRGCGMPALVAGDLDRARSLVLANLRVLGDAIRDGYTIVCSEPTAALMLRREALRLTDDLDAELVAANTMDIGQYLLGLEARGQLPPPQIPLHARVGYHQPCHQRALGIGTPGLDLLGKIPELDVEFIDRGCSGIAGTFGLSRRNFRTSLRAGRGLRRRLRDDDIEIGATECGACRMQMEQGTAKRTHHPIKLLSLAYGLNPALRRNLKAPKPKHLVS
ncbi:MAG: FAD-binding protein [Isosphaeraceae bacterium]|nr:FAD-binding protein [Isosphaeraceae bacterium]